MWETEIEQYAKPSTVWEECMAHRLTLGPYARVRDPTPDPGEAGPVHTGNHRHKLKGKVTHFVSDSLQPHGLDSPWSSPGQNTGVGSLSLLQRIFPTQGSNPGLLHCRRILYQLSHKRSSRILERVAYPFSRGSSWPRNQTGVSCIAYAIWYVKTMLCDHILWVFLFSPSWWIMGFHSPINTLFAILGFHNM